MGWKFLVATKKLPMALPLSNQISAMDFNSRTVSVIDFQVLPTSTVEECQTRWWFQRLFIFTPILGEDEPILRSIFFI